MDSHSTPVWKILPENLPYTSSFISLPCSPLPHQFRNRISLGILILDMDVEKNLEMTEHSLEW